MSSRACSSLTWARGRSRAFAEATLRAYRFLNCFSHEYWTAFPDISRAIARSIGPDTPCPDLAISSMTPEIASSVPGLMSCCFWLASSRVQLLASLPWSVVFDTVK
jgi:hypothetical protein